MRIDALQRYHRRHRQGRFDDLPCHLRLEAERILRQLCARRQGNVPRWLFAILCGRAKWLAQQPPDHAWGKRMLAKRAGYAGQRQCRLNGVAPTAEATRVRLLKRRLKKLGQRLTSVPMVEDSHLSPDLREGSWPVAAAAPAQSQKRGAESVSCVARSSTYSRLVDALNNSQPVGRSARLAALRERRWNAFKPHLAGQSPRAASAACVHATADRIAGPLIRKLRGSPPQPFIGT
jgi:hypothetical protein